MKLIKKVAALLCLVFSACGAKNARLVELEGAYNVRDMGGYETLDGRVSAWGMVYRTGDMNKLTAGDIIKMENRGIRTIIDFRSEAEMQKTPDIIFSTVKNVYPLPIDPGNTLSLEDLKGRDNEQIMQEIYRMLVRDAQEQYQRFFEIISDKANAPALFHCSAGKDRTGFAAALFLKALDVSDDTIYEDYLLSAPYVEKKYRELIQKDPSLRPLFTVKREYLEAAFDEIDRLYGDIDGYFNMLGVNKMLLREIYTKPKE